MTNLNTIAKELDIPLYIVESLADEYFDLYETADGFREDLELMIAEHSTLEAFIKHKFITKEELWQWQCPAFNFELDEDQLLKVALDRGFVEKTNKENLYKINHNYNN